MKKSLSNQFLVFILVPFIAIILIQIVSMVRIGLLQQSKMISQSNSIVENIGTNLNLITSNISEAAATFAYSKTVQEYIVTEDIGKKREQVQYISETVYLARRYNPELINTFLLDYNGKIESLLGYTNHEIEDYVTKLSKDSYFDNNEKSFLFFEDNNQETYILCFAPIFATKIANRYTDKLGTIVIVCTTKNIQSLLNSNNNMHIQIFDPANKHSILSSHPMSDNELAYNENHTRDSIYLYDLKNTNLQLVGTQFKATYDFLYQNIKLHFLTLALFTIIFVIYLNYMIKSLIIKPINIIERELSIIGDQNNNQRLSTKYSNEIGTIAVHINNMLDKISALNENIIITQTQLYEMEISKHLTQLYAYQMQVNPHFLYNMFQCMRGIAVMNDMTDIGDMCTYMSQIFRYSIKGDHFVTLIEEIEIIEKYLFLISVRFEDKITYTIDIPADLNTYKIPKMILQPIVENAVFHGLEALDTPGHLFISARIKYSMTFIVIEDNGAGIPDGQLKEIKNILSNQEQEIYSQTNGLGILNIHNRIKLYMGTQYGLSLESSNKGTIVTYALPPSVSYPQNH